MFRRIYILFAAIFSILAFASSALASSPVSAKMQSEANKVRAYLISVGYPIPPVEIRKATDQEFIDEFATDGDKTLGTTVVAYASCPNIITIRDALDNQLFIGGSDVDVTLAHEMLHHIQMMPFICQDNGVPTLTQRNTEEGLAQQIAIEQMHIFNHKLKRGWMLTTQMSDTYWQYRANVDALSAVKTGARQSSYAARRFRREMLLTPILERQYN